MLSIYIRRRSFLAFHPVVRYNTRIRLTHETLTENLDAMICVFSQYCKVSFLKELNTQVHSDDFFWSIKRQFNILIIIKVRVPPQEVHAMEHVKYFQCSRIFPTLCLRKPDRLDSFVDLIQRFF